MIFEGPRWVLAAAAIAALARAPQGDERADRLATGELRVRGPASAIEVEVPGAGRAVLDGRVPAGSEARFDLSLPAPALAISAPARVTCEGGGSAEIEPRTLADAERRARFEALPRGLRSRAPIAPPEALPPAPRPAALFLVAGLFAAGWALRRRGFASLALGAAGGALVLALERSPAEDLAVFTVAEGHGPVPAFVLVESARGRLPVGSSGDLLRLESRPSAAELVFRGSPSGRDLWVEASASTGASGAMGTTLFALRDGSGLSASREENGVFDLEQVWLRESGESEWTALGPWLRSAPLPSPPSNPAGRAGRADPPGWLIAGLPQGPAALVGGGGRRWMRWVDLP